MLAGEIVMMGLGNLKKIFFVLIINYFKVLIDWFGAERVILSLAIIK